MKNIFHTDVVGSLLRPEFLLEAQEQLKLGKIKASELTRLEDKAVREAVRLQEDVGLDVVTDGEDQSSATTLSNQLMASSGMFLETLSFGLIWMDIKSLIPSQLA